MSKNLNTFVGVYAFPKESQEKKGRIEKIIVMILKKWNYDFKKMKLWF